MPKKDTQSFQQDFAELEKIVERLESGQIDLDEAIEQFERGLALAQSCKKRLSVIENRVVEVKKKFASLAEGQEEKEDASGELPF